MRCRLQGLVLKLSLVLYALILWFFYDNFRALSTLDEKDSLSLSKALLQDGRLHQHQQPGEIMADLEKRLTLVERYFAAHRLSEEARQKLLLNSSAPMDDPQLIYAVRQLVVKRPTTAPYRLLPRYSPFYSQIHQDEIVDKLLGSKRGGFFVEAGAWDGEEFSNSLFFERARNWTGLLVEPSKSGYATLRWKNRRSLSANVCLSTERKVFMTKFIEGGPFGAISEFAAFHSNSRYDVLCLPLYSLLLAAGTLHVDYLSLDIEGGELQVLHTIPFERVNISIITVEYNQDKDKLTRINRLLQQHGYIQAVIDDVWNQDAYFIQKSLVGEWRPTSIRDFLGKSF